MFEIKKFIIQEINRGMIYKAIDGDIKAIV